MPPSSKTPTYNIIRVGLPITNDTVTQEFIDIVDELERNDNWVAVALSDYDTTGTKTRLDQHNAPLRIDYISIDTEGAELLVLQEFDFSKYQVDIFTIEHNYETAPRKAIYDILATQGYIRVFTDLSQYDDWYIHSRLMSS